MRSVDLNGLWLQEQIGAMKQNANKRDLSDCTSQAIASLETVVKIKPTPKRIRKPRVKMPGTDRSIVPGKFYGLIVEVA